MIRIENLTKRFGRRTVLDRLTMTIAEGDRAAIVGSNGAGKTTLFRCLMGHYGYEGTIGDGSGLALKRDGAFLSRIAFVPQLPPPLRMPVSELVNFAVGAGGAKSSSIGDIAAALGLDLAAVRVQPFYRLSGGQKQKVLVTLALARHAELLIFDEPSANLDPAARGAFIDLLAGMRDTSMLIASHRLEEVAPLVNRVIEMEQGRIVLDDSVADRLQSVALRHCTIRLSNPHAAFTRNIAAWNFIASSDGLSFEGDVPSAESFRFLGLVSRYASLVDRLTLDGAPGSRNGLH